MPTFTFTARGNTGARYDGTYPPKYQQVLDNINSRDYQDLNREVSPLKKPTGAIEIDTSNITIQATFDEAMNHINKILAQ